MSPSTLPFRTNSCWRWRWLHLTARGQVLHRIAKLPGNRRKQLGSPHNMPGESLCGVTGEWSMPGIFNRMDGPLCSRCRKLLRLKTEFGSPYNAGEAEPACQRPPSDGALKATKKRGGKG